MDPMTLMSASSRGSSTDRLTAACAARCTTASGFALRKTSSKDGLRMSAT